MGFFGTTCRLMVGAAIGVYIAQNYDVPNIKKFADSYLLKAKSLEETYRKSGSFSAAAALPDAKNGDDIGSR